MIVRIDDPKEKQHIARMVLEALTEWFEVEESRERYIEESADQIFLAAKEDDEIAGFLCLKETGKATVELAVMGMKKNYHRKGYGRALFEQAKKIATQSGYSFIQVKTVRMGMYEDYDITNRFYLSCGFKEFEVIPELWGEDNPCQIYIMSLKPATGKTRFKYVRIEGKELAKNTMHAKGIFSMCWQLIQRDVMVGEDADLFKEIDGWFAENLPWPPQCKAQEPVVCWFKTENSDEMIKMIRPAMWLLERYNHPYFVVYTNDPGEIVYEDRFQIAAKADGYLQIEELQPSWSPKET